MENIHLVCVSPEVGWVELGDDETGVIPGRGGHSVEYAQHYHHEHLQRGR